MEHFGDEMTSELFQMRNGVTHLFDKLWNGPIKLSIMPESKRQQSFEEALEFMIRKIGSFLQGFPYRDILDLHPERKSNSKAHCLRDSGNREFRPMQLDRLAKALLLYNESIANAEKGSEDRAMAYANRAAVCLLFRRYEDCLVNTRLARECNYPAELGEKLKQREEIAKKSLSSGNTNDGTTDSAAQNDRKKAVEELKLSYNAHTNAPQVAECLRLRRDAVFGRHVVTDRALKAGDVVMIEKPFVSMLATSSHFTRCACCHEERSFILIPCEGCTMEMYCSEECLSKAQHYHRYECGAMRDLWRIAHDGLNGMAGLRAIAVAITMFGNNLDAFKKHLDELDESKVNAFTMDWKMATHKDIYNTVHVLATNDATRNRKEMALQIFHSTIIHQLLLERTELGALCAANPKKEKQLFDLILRHWQIAQTNIIFMRSVYFGNDDGKDQTYPVYAFGYFPLLSMLNHSCVPNVHRVTLSDGRIALVAINPIAAGEQLFASYFIPTGMDPKRVQMILLEGFNFYCRCDACELRFDTPAKNMDDIRFVQRIQSIKPASKRLERLVAYMNEPARHYLPYSLTSLQIVFLIWAQQLYSDSTFFNRMC